MKLYYFHYAPINCCKRVHVNCKHRIFIFVERLSPLPPTPLQAHPWAFELFGFWQSNSPPLSFYSPLLVSHLITNGISFLKFSLHPIWLLDDHVYNWFNSHLLWLSAKFPTPTPGGRKGVKCLWYAEWVVRGCKVGID